MLVNRLFLLNNLYLLTGSSVHLHAMEQHMSTRKVVRGLQDQRITLAQTTPTGPRLSGTNKPDKVVRNKLNLTSPRGQGDGILITALHWKYLSPKTQPRCSLSASIVPVPGSKSLSTSLKQENATQIFLNRRHPIFMTGQTK